jgi:hypothetical protein
MTSRRVWLPFTMFAVLALLALLASGLRGVPIRAFALGVPNVRTVAVARPRALVCEGPFSSQHAFQSAVLSATHVSGKPLVRIWSQDAGGRKLVASGPLEASPSGVSDSYTAVLSNAVDADVLVDICLADPDGEFRLQGYVPGYSGVAIVGSRPREAFSLVLLESGTHSFIGSLGLAFSRAALFRPSWVGPWTFWVLLLALLGTVPLGALAISAAARSEDEDAE